MAVGLRTAACESVEGIEETSLRAFAKLDQILPSRLRKRVGALQSHVEPLHWRPPDAPVDPESLAVLSMACRDHEQVRFDYADKEGAETRRLVEPFRLVPAGQRWYLVAWDVRREDWRTFRVDRASRPRLAGVRTKERTLPAADAPTFVRQSISGTERPHPTVDPVPCAARRRRATPAPGRRVARCGRRRHVPVPHARLRTRVAGDAPGGHGDRVHRAGTARARRGASRDRRADRVVGGPQHRDLVTATSRRPHGDHAGSRPARPSVRSKRGASSGT